jgi:cytochrome c-type biogenesis protein CcmH
MTLLRILTVLLAAGCLMGITTRSEEFLPDPDQEAKARTIMEDLRCLVCQGQSIANSDADLAHDLRVIVREQVAAGKSPDEVKQYMQARYGDWVLLKPPVKSSTYLLWLGPLFIFIAGGVVLFLSARRLKREGGDSLDAPETGSGDDIL